MKAKNITIASLQSAKQREAWVKNKQGDLVGGNYRIPKGDFARFLGFKPATKAEAQGKQVGASRVLELAMQREFNALGARAMKRGANYRNMFIAGYKTQNDPQRRGHSFEHSVDAMRSSMEFNRASNLQYLEMQYKFQQASKSFGVISNLMKARNESTKKSIQEIR